MEDDDIDITELIEKYEQMNSLGKQMYLDADEFSMLIEYYNSQGRLDESVKLIEEGLSMHPGNSELMILKAKEMVYEQAYDEALTYLDTISDEGEIDIPLLKIESFLHTERMDEANDLIHNVLQSDLTTDQLYLFYTEVGFMLNDVDEYDRSIPFLEESLKIDETNAEVLIDLSYAYEMSNNVVKAIEYNNQLLDIDPYSFESWVNIGKLYSMNGQYGKAVEAFDFALAINEKDLNALKLKALSLILNDNAEEAIGIFQDCLAESPDDITLYDSLLEAYETMEEYDQMFKIIDLREERFGSEGITIKRSWVYFHKKQIQKAKEIFEQVPESERDTLEYYWLEGELEVQEERFLEAEKSFMKAAILSEDNDNIIDRLANISVVLGKFEQAAEYLEQLLEMDPNYPAAKSKLAFARFEIGAKEPFDEIVKKFTDEELKSLLLLFSTNDEENVKSMSRENLLMRLDEARENRLLFKNIKY